MRNSLLTHLGSVAVSQYPHWAVGKSFLSLVRINSVITILFVCAEYYLVSVVYELLHLYYTFYFKQTIKTIILY